MEYRVVMLLDWAETIIACKEVTLPFVPPAGMWIEESDDPNLFENYLLDRIISYSLPLRRFQALVRMVPPAKMTYNEWVRELVEHHGWSVEDCEGYSDEPWASVPLEDLEVQEAEE